ncbi:Probable CtpA-like serine protease [Anaerococcus prevotii]|uniref:Carboxyl-terminal protease n=1 Tax=Anaerococcus prevotii (strain ATCC 9321 / DSM 20548 / JCM 6508 / NCTC 11806 / PC1) TaxID=525919 RepID=C7RFQ6_ANAPD|nr:S41 family peptidase [Anaerococcus prevotii]ACV28317.1 carboxyl-terminal protease [Anaerococcus prevotii DSM 20548]SUU93872.1 Probable CtpA-like serine protease [Anaerococcus prevotii]
MKKFGKVILALVLTAGVGFTGYIVGLNRDLNATNKSEDQAHIEDMHMLKSLLDKNFLFDYDEKDLYEGSLKGMFANLGDPYTQYYSKDEFSKLMETLDGRYKGIGVLVQASKEGFIKVVQVFDGSPASEAGLKEGDYIIKVEGKEYSADQMEEAVAIMKGEEDTNVKITVRRMEEDGKNFKDIDMEVARRDVKVDTIDESLMEIRDKKIGYIHIKSFDDVTGEDFEASYKKLKDAGMEGLVLDLRNNPGGSLDVCLDIADKFLDKGVIVTTEDKKGEVITEESDEDKDDIPMTVLVNENSASASEILSGALKDRDRAKIIGKKTFGKGIVQKLFPLDDGSGAKITISEYHTPSGAKINKVGVEPDIEVENTEEGLEISKKNFSKDDQFKKALQVLLDQMGE